jgi:deoxyribose-phosphate aldolase
MASSHPTNGEIERKVTVSLPILSKMIDHSLLHPTMTDADIEDGLKVSVKYNTATACIKPYLIPLAKKYLAGTEVGICPVIGFPAGNSTTVVKVFEADEACNAIGPENIGKAEIDMVINIGKALGHDWDYVKDEIRQVNDVVTKHGAILKVIFENDYLSSTEITELCHICTEIGVAFVKTSTGYGFVKQKDGSYNYKGATHEDLRLMRKECGSQVQIKAAGGVRTLDDLIAVMSLGTTRIGATATEAIIAEAVKRGITNDEIQINVKQTDGSGAGGY